MKLDEKTHCLNQREHHNHTTYEKRKPAETQCFRRFLAGAEGLEPSARGFGVDVGKRTGGTGEGQCCPVSNASPGEDGAGLVLWEIFRAKTGEKEREIPEKT